MRDVAVVHVARAPRGSGLQDCVVCYIASGDTEADAGIAVGLKGAGALINVADQPRLCDFIAPSIVDRSPLVIAISTGGASPMLGRVLRSRLESSIPVAYGRLAAFMGRARAQVAAKLPSADERRRFWER